MILGSKALGRCPDMFTAYSHWIGSHRRRVTSDGLTSLDIQECTMYLNKLSFASSDPPWRFNRDGPNRLARERPERVDFPALAHPGGMTAPSI